MRVADTIHAFYGDAGTENDGVSQNYKEAVEDLDTRMIRGLDGPYRYEYHTYTIESLKYKYTQSTDYLFRSTVLDPITRFCNYFPDVNECIKKRTRKLADYDVLCAKVRKFADKPDKERYAAKLPLSERDTAVAKQNYEQLNEQLCTELPQLVDLRVPYLDPSFEALVKIQLRFCAESYSRVASVQKSLNSENREQYNLDYKIEKVLQEIRDLSIAGAY